jgi:hypothetical protein
VYFRSVKSTQPKTIPISGVIMSATSEETILPKAVQITTATAKSITLPFKANFLKSSTNFLHHISFKLNTKVF